MEYAFEDLSIDVDGAQVGYFSGTAYLVADRAGFWVSNICLTGPQGVVWLGVDGSPLMVELFRAIEAAIDSSTHARDAWAAHCESERADAA
jgi:hypothetical protein